MLDFFAFLSYNSLIVNEKGEEMNERIRDLAEQCYEKHELLGTYEFNKEKFAKLIVRECLSKIELEAEQYHEPAWAVELVNDIKDHFGVEK